MNAAVPPGYDAFRAAYEAKRGALVWRHDVADLLTPVAAFLKLAHGKKFSFLLESVEGGAARGRYSVIGMSPDLIWRCDKGVASINRNAQSTPDAFEPIDAAPLDSLRSLITETRLDIPDGLPPMTGGLSGYLGYDMVRLMERLPNANPNVLGTPDGILVRPSLFAIFDGVTDELTLAAPVYPRDGVTAGQAYAAAEERLAEAAAA
jgi:anthranilate synthase component 1